jgi:hypothetical protein
VEEFGELSCLRHLFPVDNGFCTEESIEIVFTSVSPNSVYLAIANYVCRESVDVAKSQPY